MNEKEFFKGFKVKVTSHGRRKGEKYNITHVLTPDRRIHTMIGKRTKQEAIGIAILQRHGNEPGMYIGKKNFSKYVNKRVR